MRTLEFEVKEAAENTNPAWLLDFAKNTYSQKGEDGVIAKVLSMLPERDHWCVEFGAWDGRYLSNVRRLIEQEDYSAVFIEGNPEKFKELEANYAGQPKVRNVNTFVGFTAQDGLDTILAKHPIPKNFDFLSIDIDGNDLHVWKALREYRPKVVCIEFNPTIPTEVNWVQPADPKLNQGASLKALSDLARSKGYELVCVLSYNAIFVDRQYFAAFGIADNRPETLRRDLSFVTWLFVGFDGSVHLEGAKRLQWHGLRLREEKFQALPKILRSYPLDYCAGKKFLFRVLARLGVI